MSNKPTLIQHTMYSLILYFLPNFFSLPPAFLRFEIKNGQN
jgi:hypothetical protein